jgi:hypothetical protein
LAQLQDNEMLEQFRILQTALRLGEFTIGDLARESGVARGTVDKMVWRRADLFRRIKGPPTGRRGGQPDLLRIKEETVRAAIQAEADAIPLPEPPSGLGIALAQDTLVRVLPRADAEDRAELIAAAENHLKLAGGVTAGSPDMKLVELHRDLRVLVAMQQWLASRLQQLGGSPAYNTIVESLEAVLSFNKRLSRDGDKSEVARTAGAFARIQVEASTLATYAAKTSAEPAPLSKWWIELPAAVWSVIGNELWVEVTGDLTQPELFIAQMTNPVGASERTRIPDDLEAWVIDSQNRPVMGWQNVPGGLYGAALDNAFGTNPYLRKGLASVRRRARRIVA